MDFEAMSAAEIAAAKADIRRLALPLDLQRTRRRRADPPGPHVDLRATLRASLRQGGEILDIARSRRVTRPPPLVVLCDISGSMSRYAQILLHFLHAVANDRDRVHIFLFGTRLSNVTRQLRHRDPEVAFQLVSHAVPDWSGGTRIGEALAQFNRRWARRVLGQGAVVLLVTDGLDRDGAAGLAESMDRLHKSCARLIWLNPLLRWDGFAPKSQGIRAMLPHVDEFRPVHNLASLRALVQSLSRPASPREMDRWRMAVMSTDRSRGRAGHRRRLARRRRAGGAGHGDRDLGQFAAPGRQPDGGDGERQDGRLGQRRLHRGRGGRGGDEDHRQRHARRCWISA